MVDAFVITLIVTLFEAIDRAFEGMRFCQANGAILHDRINTLKPHVQKLLRDPRVPEDLTKALTSLRVHLTTARDIFLQCGKGTLYCLLFNRQLEASIINVNTRITNALADFHFLKDALKDFQFLNGAAPIEFARGDSPAVEVDYSSVETVLRGLDDIQALTDRDIQDITFRQDMEDLQEVREKLKKLQADLMTLQADSKKQREDPKRVRNGQPPDERPGSVGQMASGNSVIEELLWLLERQHTQRPRAGMGEANQVDIPARYKCPITGRAMVDPVFLSSSGPSYERAAILRRLRGGGRGATGSNQPVETLEVTPNIDLRDEIRAWAARTGFALPIQTPTFLSQDSGISASLVPLPPRLQPGSTLDGLKTRAMRGDRSAQFQLAICYSVPCLGASLDEAAAARWYERAGDGPEGLPQAWAALSDCYFHGKGVPQDKKRGVEYAGRVIHLEEPMPKLVLGTACVEGSGGVTQIVVQAKRLITGAETELLRWATEGKDPLFQTALGLKYWNEDEGKAVYWLGEAAANGAALANALLGRFYLKQRDLPQSTLKHKMVPLEKPFGHYKEAAVKGHVPSQHVVGECYLAGKGVGKSRKDAAAWFRKAADSGYAPAQLALAKSLPLAQAIPYFEMAAAQDLAEAYYELSLVYKEGTEQTLFGKKGKDPDKAHQLLGVAAALGHPEAAADLKVQAHQLARAKARVELEDNLIERAHSFGGAGVMFRVNSLDEAEP